MQIHSEQAAWKEGMREDVIILEQGPCRYILSRQHGRKE